MKIIKIIKINIYMFCNKSMCSQILQWIVLFVMLIFLLFPGCLSIKTHVKGVEPNARPISTGEYTIISSTELATSSFKLFWFIPVTPEPGINEAIDNIIIRSGGDNLIEVKVWHERQYWILGTVDIIRVNGIIIRYK